MVVRLRTRRIVWRVVGLLVLLLVISAGILNHYFGPVSLRPGASLDDPAPMARWPWPHAKTDTPHPGVTHWIDRSSPDGTVVELFDFDFQNNPNLRLELYDQDEDDAKPFDNKSKFWDRGVGQVTRHLNKIGRGRVVAAWNGLFFQYANGVGGHVAPVVLDGKALYNVGVVRWAFGVKYEKNGPVFKAIRLPEFGTLAKEFDFAAEGASYLIRRAQPLRLEPFPEPGEDPFPPSKVPGPDDAGFVRRVDHIRTSRTSMGWSEDNRHFYLLIVKDAGAEAASLQGLRHRLPPMGGWTVADLQRFWQSFGAWGAINIDGGDVTQMTALRPDGKYDMVPPRWTHPKMRIVLPSDCAGAPPGGSMMYFFVRDVPGQ